MEYFAGANTRYGFKSLFDECFKNVERLFILKGSSGCGKSTLMRRVAGHAEKKGYRTDIIRCSADPDSLDGVIVPELGIAIADGTAPHIMDVKYPCVRESIINLGRFWDEAKLLPSKEKIISLTDKKSNHYSNAYRCLSALGSVEELKKQIVAGAIRREKLDETVFSIADKAINGSGREARLFAAAFTANGTKTLPVFGDVKRLYRLSGYASSSVMSSLYGVARERGSGFIVSLSPIDPSLPDSLYFEETSTLVTLLETPPCASAEEDKLISCAKFTDNNILAASRARLRGLDKLSAELVTEAKNELATAKSIHNDIEAIYIPAMNFKLLDEYTFELTESIFGE